MESESHSLPDLPLGHQARASISLALRLNAEGKTEEATAIFETLGRQVRDAGPCALLIEGNDTGPVPNLQALVALVQQCVKEISEAGQRAAPPHEHEA